MPTETIQIEKLRMTDESNAQTIYFWINDQNQIFITNDDEDVYDASTFWFNISKEDWSDIKYFIDNQLAK